MKLHENEKVVETLECILRKDYPHLKLEYDAKESKKDKDVLHVKVTDPSVDREFGVTYHIICKLEHKLKKQDIEIGFDPNPIMHSSTKKNWTYFNIRRS